MVAALNFLLVWSCVLFTLKVNVKQLEFRIPVHSLCKARSYQEVFLKNGNSRKAARKEERAMET